MKQRIDIDVLIDIVSNGGIIKTGVDILNSNGVLLLEKHVPVSKVRTLLTIKTFGITHLEIDPGTTGGMWDGNGNPLSVSGAKRDGSTATDRHSELSDVEFKIREINRQKSEAVSKYHKAKESIKQVISDIRRTGGEFDFTLVEHTVSDIFNFLTRNSSAFIYLTKEIFSYDDYLYNHSVNVCTIGTAVLNRFNDHFSEIVNNFLNDFFAGNSNHSQDPNRESFINYLPTDLQDISIGYFLHDIGKVLIPGEILNKPGRLSAEEFELVKTHSYEKGVDILNRNQLKNLTVETVVKYHHSALHRGETNCYPTDKLPIELPPFVKVAKLVDIYDAMTSKRCYKEALNPVSVVTEIYRKYAEKDRMLQFILHSFVKTLGICPPGSIISLRNGQMCYVLTGEGPIVLPVTDTSGHPLRTKPDPIDLGKPEAEANGMRIDRRKPLRNPIEIYDQLPAYVQQAIRQDL